MVDFYTDWCGWCKVLDQKTYTDARVIKTTGAGFVAVKVNAEKEGIALAKKYKVSGFPTILFLNPSTGEVVSQVVGYAPPAPFVDELQAAVSLRSLPALVAKGRSNPNDLATQGKLVMMYSKKQNAAAAQSALAQVVRLDSDDSKGYLAKAYNAVADMYQAQNNFDEAIPLFRKAITVGKSAEPVGYGYSSIAACYQAQRNLPKIIAVLEEEIADARVSASDKKEAQAGLSAARQVQKQAGAKRPVNGA